VPAEFVTIVTETLPAGLLPRISHGLGVSQPSAGQLVAVYALGSMVAAILLASATATWPRRGVLLAGVVGFRIANDVTASSTDYAIRMTARFLTGVVTGLVWGTAGRLRPGRWCPHAERDGYRASR
jgi:predicted MFS family arabinose efflux permease